MCLGQWRNCTEQSLTIPFSDISLSNQSLPILTTDVSIPVVGDTPVLSPVTFQKQTLCSATTPCPEICDNQFDDDEDGYVDCFDSDCACFEPEPDCSISPPPTPLSGKTFTIPSPRHGDALSHYLGCSPAKPFIEESK